MLHGDSWPPKNQLKYYLGAFLLGAGAPYLLVLGGRHSSHSIEIAMRKAYVSC